MTVEGVPCAVGFGGVKKYCSAEDVLKFGIHSLEIHRVNGSAIDPPVTLGLSENVKYAPTDHYKLRGYQTGKFGPEQPDPKRSSVSMPQTNYQLAIYFVPAKAIDESLLKKQSEVYIKAAMADLVEDKKVNHYFKKIKINDLKISDKLSSPNAEGWILRSSYTSGVSYVPNPNKTAASPVKRVYADNDSIHFEIFVSFKNGDEMVSRTKMIELLDEPRVIVGYCFKTKDNAPNTLKAVDDLMRKHLFLLKDSL